jgi:RNA polymerase sigma factor (sigma-70 family)
MNPEPVVHVPPSLATDVRVAGGSEPLARAFDAQAVYEAEYADLVRLARSLVDRREQAEEIVQEAFVRALGRWSRLDNPGGYLRTAVVNGCRNELRRRAVRRRRDRVAATTPTTADVTGAHGEADALLRALAGLAPRRRIALVLRFYLDRPEAEIAELLGVRPATVRSLTSRGLADLRKVVER